MHPQSVALITVSLIFPLLAFLAVGLRIWARFISQTSFNASDYAIFITLVSSEVRCHPSKGLSADLCLDPSDRASNSEHCRWYHWRPRSSPRGVVAFGHDYLHEGKILPLSFDYLLLIFIHRFCSVANSS